MKHYGAVDDPKDITTKEYVDAADNALKVKKYNQITFRKEKWKNKVALQPCMLNCLLR